MIKAQRLEQLASEEGVACRRPSVQIRRTCVLGWRRSCVLDGLGRSQATPSKRVGTIAFIRLVDGPIYGGRLFVVRPDGGGLRQLTPQGTTLWSYAWSPDGKLIAYIDERFESR